MYNAREWTLEHQGGRMNCISFGKGNKKLIMIQGLNTRSIKGAAVSLAFMYRMFAQDYTVYLFDRREELGESISVRDMAEDIALAMDELSVTSADVLGVSQGGMIAQYLAIDRPDLVNKLVLAVTLSRNNDTVQDVIESWIDMTRQGSFKELALDMAEKMYSDAYLKRYRPFLPLLTVLQKPKDVPRFVKLAEACLSCRTYEELEKIKCPVLVIGAGKDKIVGAEASEEIAEKLGCRIHMYKELGHAAYEEAKDFNGRVLEFFRQ